MYMRLHMYVTSCPKHWYWFMLLFYSGSYGYTTCLNHHTFAKQHWQGFQLLERDTLNKRKTKAPALPVRLTCVTKVTNKSTTTTTNETNWLDGQHARIDLCGFGNGTATANGSLHKSKLTKTPQEKSWFPTCNFQPQCFEVFAFTCLSQTRLVQGQLV